MTYSLREDDLEWWGNVLMKTDVTLSNSQYTSEYINVDRWNTLTDIWMKN